MPICVCLSFSFPQTSYHNIFNPYYFISFSEGHFGKENGDGAMKKHRYVISIERGQVHQSEWSVWSDVDGLGLRKQLFLEVRFL